MKRIILLLLLISFSSCNDININQKEKPSRRELIEKRIHRLDSLKGLHKTKKISQRSKMFGHECAYLKFEELPEISNVEIGNEKAYDFKFYSQDYELTKIEIFKEERLHQKIQPNSSYQGKYQFIDWNFDGYKDLTVLNNQGSGGFTYDIWFFNPDKELFEYSDDLSGRLGLEIDTIQQRHIIHYREGANHEYWNGYSYKNGTKEFFGGVNREVLRYEGKEWQVYKRKTIVDGNVSILKDSVISARN